MSRNFDEFFAESWGHVLRATYAVTRDQQRAEDAVQSAFVKAYASWPRISRAQDPLAYVRRMAFHAAIEQGRLAFRRRESPTSIVPEVHLPESPTDPAQRLDLWDAVGALPPKQRAVIVLRYYEDLSEMQIANTLGIPPGTVKSQTSTAMATLRRLLGDLLTSDAEGGESS